MLTEHHQAFLQLITWLILITVAVTAAATLLVALIGSEKQSQPAIRPPASRRPPEDLATVFGRLDGIIEPGQDLTAAQRRTFLSDEHHQLHGAAAAAYGEQFVRVHVDRDGRYWIALLDGRMLPAVEPW